jgi:polyhydroxyalkanoate synthase
VEDASLFQALGGGDVVGALDPAEMSLALTDLMDPGLLAAQAPALAAELVKVALGLSDVTFPARDARFADPAWRENPLYRRVGQGYLAWERSLGAVVEGQRGDWKRQARARYLANILTGALAPTNVLPGNPAALKRALETGGASVLRGIRNLVRDVVSNGGMPSMVDSRPFRVGENLAVSPGAVVYREEMFELLQYAPATEKVRERPLLMVPPELNRYYVLDLAPGRSFVEFAVSRGVQTFMVVWRNPREEAGQGYWGLADYLGAHLRAFDVVREITGAGDINLLGLCAGGITSAVTQAHLAARGDNPVHSCTYLVTMLDSRLPNMATMMTTPQVHAVLRKAADEGKVLRGMTLRHNFAWMRPNDLVFSYVVNNWLLGNDPPAFDVMAWNDDSTNLAGRFEWDSVGLLAEGKLAEPGGVTVLGTPIDLSKITCDNFMVAGLADHITTWQPCYRSSQLLGGPAEVVIVDSGHIQSFVNPAGTSRYSYWAGPADGPDADAWLAARDKQKGSWWPHWAGWLLPRSGEERPAPAALGGPRYPALEPAPGRYVHEK